MILPSALLQADCAKAILQTAAAFIIIKCVWAAVVCVLVVTENDTNSHHLVKNNRRHIALGSFALAIFVTLLMVPPTGSGLRLFRNYGAVTTVMWYLLYFVCKFVVIWLNGPEHVYKLAAGTTGDVAKSYYAKYDRIQAGGVLMIATLFADLITNRID